MKTIDDTTDRGKRFIILVILGLFFINCNHEKTPDRTPPAPPVNPPAKNEVDFWLTNGDQTVKLQKQNSINNGYFGPHATGGCDACKGAITVPSSSSFNRNVSYYIIAHVSKFVPAGSTRISNSVAGNLSNVAFKTPAGKKVLVVENDRDTKSTFNVKYNDKWITTSLNGGSVGTFVW
ncbi:MAG: glycoside hydrolase family 30 beta sandwich domain-containing protein [Ginsengibacter sp.]